MNLDPVDEDRIQRIRIELEQQFMRPIPEEEIKKYLPGIPFRRTGVIQLTKLNGTQFVLNSELIETIESTPDTIVTLVTGRKYIVREPVDEVKDKCIQYKKTIFENRIN